MRVGQNNGRIASNWAGIRMNFHRTEECLGVYYKFVVLMILSFLPTSIMNVLTLRIFLENVS
jgi:hypothetical protein